MKCFPTLKILCGKRECEVCFPRSFLAFLEEKGIIDKWLQDKNPGIDPISLISGSTKSINAKCKVCEHEYNTKPVKYISRGGCTYCVGPYACEDLECEICKPNRFITYVSVECLFPELNPDINLSLLKKNSGKNVRIKCKRCPHIILILPNSYIKSTGCKYCVDGGGIVCEDLTCEACEPNRFVSHVSDPEMFRELNPNINIDLLRQNSAEKIKAKCKCCEHLYETRPCKYIKRKGCKYCTGHSVCKDDGCLQCYLNSFASNPMSKYWSYTDNVGRPRDYRRRSGFKFVFDCSICLCKYIATLHMISVGSWCPCTKNKTEAKLHQWLLLYYSDIERLFRLPSLLDRRYDFYIPSLQVIIELDGPQHFRQISNWASPSLQLKLDTFKSIKANEHNIPVIRVLWEDLYYDKNDWEKWLVSQLNNQQYNKIIYPNNPIYDSHKQLYMKARNIRDMLCGIDNKDTKIINTLISALKIFNTDDECILFNRNISLDNLDSKIIERYNMEITDELYSGIRRFIEDILGIDIQMYISEAGITIILDKSNSLLHLFSNDICKK